MNIIQLFPKRKRVVGYNTETGKRTAHSLRKERRWEDMMSDLSGCENHHQIVKCALYWSTVIEHEKWPQVWSDLAIEEFDKATRAIEALAAQQAE